MTISISGGKGGTGKTFIAVNLAVFLAKKGYKTLLVDCDVENPNTYLLLGYQAEEFGNLKMKTIFQYIPSFIEDKCEKCGLCSSICRVHAIFQIQNQKPILMEHMCSGCKLCEKICEYNAITASKKVIGDLTKLEGVKLKDEREKLSNLDLLVGLLKVGEARSVKIVEELFTEVKELDLKKKYDYIIADSAPGAHCDVEFVLSQANKIVFITEPTPLGGHDLNRVLKLANLIEKKSCVLINRFGIAEYTNKIQNIITKNDSKLIGKIPIDQDILESYARQIPFIIYMKDEIQKKSITLSELKHSFEKIIRDAGVG